MIKILFKFQNFQTSLTFIFCLRLITINWDKEKQKSNWFKIFKPKEKFEPQHKFYWIFKTHAAPRKRPGCVLLVVLLMSTI